MATEYRSEAGQPDDSNGNPGGVIDPAAVASAGHEPEPGERKRRKRSDAGQPRGSRAGSRTGAAKASQKVALDLSAITGMFVGLHVMLADRTNTPEIAITEEEGKNFMEAAQNVMRHYSVETTQKTLDWLAFIGTGSAMYMPRIAAIGMRKRASQRPAPPRQPGSRTPAPGPAPSGEVIAIAPDMIGSAGFQEGE